MAYNRRYQRKVYRPKRFGAVANVLSAGSRALSRYATNAVARRAASAAGRAVANIARRGVKRSRVSTTYAPTVRRYRRTQYVTRGRIGKKFPRTRRVRFGSISTHGVTLRAEYGGVMTQDKVCYLGHTTCVHDQILKTIVWALVRRLAYMAGQKIVSMKEQVAHELITGVAFTPGFIQYWYETSDDGEAKAKANVAIGATDNWGDVCQSIVASIEALVISSTHAFRLMDMVWLPYSMEATPANLPPYAKLKVQDCMIKLKVYSDMKFQNRTKANSGAGDETSMLDIENNPLTGKSYFNKTSGFKLNFTNDNTNTFSLVGRNLSGLIAADPDDATITTEMQEQLRLAPRPGMFRGVKNCVNVKLAPGEIRTSKLRFNTTMMVNTVIQRMFNYLRDETTKSLTFMGNSRLFAFEKMLDTGSAEPDMSIGFEINNWYSAVVAQRPQQFIIDKVTGTVAAP